MSASRRRDETAKKIAAKMAKLQGVGDNPAVVTADAPSPTGVQPTESVTPDSPATAVEAGAVPIRAVAQEDDQSDDSTAPASTPNTSDDEDQEADQEIAAIEAEGIDALVSVDEGIPDIPELHAPAPLPVSEQGELITIHFLEDGLGFDGRIRYRGEEITCRRGDETYQKTVDRNGDSWLDLSEREQIYKWEKVMFRPGPWPYQSIEETLKEQGYGDPNDRKAMKKKQRESAPPLPMSRG